MMRAMRALRARRSCSSCSGCSGSTVPTSSTAGCAICKSTRADAGHAAYDCGARPGQDLEGQLRGGRELASAMDASLMLRWACARAPRAGCSASSANGESVGSNCSATA
eukprot:6193642-Pleurochrysis_carterae.AAC.1